MGIGLEDLLRCKIRTTGIIEHRMMHNYNNEIYPYSINDVGGERSERKKWIHCFDNVSVVIYVCALDQYGLSLREDNSKNALIENMEVFEQIVNREWFDKTQIILLLNRCDLFKKALITSPLTNCFGDEYKGRNCKEMGGILDFLFYEFQKEFDMILSDDVRSVIQKFLGPTDWFMDACYRDGVDFIKEKYLKLIQDPNRNISVFETVAISHAEMQNVWSKIQQIILSHQETQLQHW